MDQASSSIRSCPSFILLALPHTAERILQLIENGIYEGFISLLTVEEILKAPKKIRDKLETKILETGFITLEETEESIELADAYLQDGDIPVKYRDDARHVAISVCYGLDYIVSWNYKHMVNISVRRLINSTNIRMKYNTIEIISPEEVTEDGEMEI